MALINAQKKTVEVLGTATPSNFDASKLAKTELIRIKSC